jgi:hypothetical protein
MTARCLCGALVTAGGLNTTFGISPHGTLRYWCTECKRLVGVTGKPR